MSRGAMAMLSETESSKTSSRRASSLRVNEPGDAHEVEADRVADTVVRGGRVAGWSLSASQAGGVQRDPAPAPAAASPSLSDIAAAVAPALLATPAGKKVVDAAISVITTPVGGSITGAAAIGIISGLAKAKKPLPAQLPEIPLDFIRKGLSVKLTWDGNVGSPTDGAISLKYEPKGDDAKPQAQGQRIGAETKALMADREKFKASMHPMARGVGPLAGPESDQQLTDRMIANYNTQKLLQIGNFARPLPGVPAAAPAPVTAPEAKKEEVPVQRKAESAAPVQTGSAGVDAVVRSGGQPLDASTRRAMESRIGFDFSKVRVHVDERAADSADALNARAYTSGHHVVFASGRYSPQSREGQRLLAHELTHVVQQGKAESASRQPQRSAITGPARAESRGV